MERGAVAGLSLSMKGENVGLAAEPHGLTAVGLR